MITLPGTRLTRWLAHPLGWLRFVAWRLYVALERAWYLSVTRVLELWLRLHGIEPPPEPKPIDVAWPEDDNS